MRIGIVASSGGSAFDSMRQILTRSGGEYEFYVATDRECGIEALCRRDGIEVRRFAAPDNTDFSTQTAAWFQSKGGMDLVVLYFLRLVTKELFSAFPTFNIHPSLLPAFRGFNPIERAHKEQVRFLGATAHRVDETPDGGPLVAQVTMPIGPQDGVERLHKYSFVQKVYLSVLLVEMHRQGASHGAFTDRCNPKLDSTHLWQALQDFQAEQGVEVIK